MKPIYFTFLRFFMGLHAWESVVAASLNFVFLCMQNFARYSISVNYIIYLENYQI